MHIEVHNDTATVRFRLNDTPAARALYAQLPLRVEVENYSTNEKIFYPPEKLETAQTPLANAKTGTLAYYAPWGNVVMFYADFGKAGGLYELGHAVSGAEYLQTLSGTITLKHADEALKGDKP